MIDEQSSASKHDCASDRSAIGAGRISGWSGYLTKARLGLADSPEIHRSHPNLTRDILIIIHNLLWVKWFGGSVRCDAKCSGGVTLKDVILYRIKLLKIVFSY